MKVVVTRPRDQAGPLVARLEAVLAETLCSARPDGGDLREVAPAARDLIGAVGTRDDDPVVSGSIDGRGGCRPQMAQGKGTRREGLGDAITAVRAAAAARVASA